MDTGTVCPKVHAPAVRLQLSECGRGMSQHVRLNKSPSDPTQHLIILPPPQNKQSTSSVSMPSEETPTNTILPASDD
ncbi:hypothetical protein QQF64_027857 [Cirrhinus molitorella]|uniref:Uncharacterized protein n=1 Tax=Cirrhinus molitorella TaxID=172907 RepID=A0ABR3NDJ4_9TELE